jgi:hypothetical protein
VNANGSPGAYRYILAKGASGCIAASYALYSGPNGGLEFYVSRSKGTMYASSADAGTGVWDGGWHLVVGTFDGTTIRLFVDGSEVGSGTAYPGPIEYLLPDSNDLYTGNYPGCREHSFRGEISDVTVWNRVLTPTEVAALELTSQNQPDGSAPDGIAPIPSSPGQSPGGTAPTPSSPAQSPGGTAPTPSSPGQSPGATAPTPSSPGQSPGGTAPIPSSPGQASALDAPRILRRLRVSPSVFALVRGRHGRGGARITFTATRAGRVTFFVLRSMPGIRKGGMCLQPAAHAPVTPRLRCTRSLPIGHFARANGIGSNGINFTGLPGRTLAPGRYALEAVPTAAGLAGASVSTTFTVVPARR